MLYGYIGSAKLYPICCLLATAPLADFSMLLPPTELKQVVIFATYICYILSNVALIDTLIIFFGFLDSRYEDRY